MAKKSSDAVELKPLKLETVSIPIEGTSELIVHAWSEKAKRMILDKQMKVSKAKKDAKDPREDYEASMYRFPDGRHGFPAGGFKAAIVGACRLFEGVTMTIAKVSIVVEGTDGTELVEIKGEPRMREDMVRVGAGLNKTADIRYRAGYLPWSAVLTITYNAGAISLEQLVNLVNGAGFGGIGEWRPSAPSSASGNFGRFRVVAGV